MTIINRLAAAVVLCGAVQVLGADGFFIEGTVVDSQSHKPLANIRVILAPSKARDQRTETRTKDNGHFSFPVALAGKYALKISKPGYPPQDYKQAGFSGVATAIVVREDQDTRHIVFEAVRAGDISGQIKDEDSEPVSNALVAVFQSVVSGGERTVVPRGQVRANARGEFRVANLPPGSYYVCAMGRPWFADSVNQLQQMNASAHESERLASRTPKEPDDASEPDEPLPPYSPDPNFRGTAFATTFYPNAQTFETASLIRVDSGAQQRVSITLPSAKAVSIKGTITAPGEISGGTVLLSKRIYNRYMTFLTQSLNKDGVFQFSNIPAGFYEINGASNADQGPASWSVRQEVEIGSNDIEIHLAPAPFGAFSGKVLFDGKPPAPGASLSLALRNEKGEVIRREVNPQGAFSFNRVPARRYEVSAAAEGYIAAYLKDETGSNLPLTIDIAPGTSVRQDVVLTGNLATIDGTVEHDGTLQVGVFVFLMAKNPALRWAYRQDQTDSDGSYTLATIPAGDYFLIALSSREDVAYRDPKVAAALAQGAKQVQVAAADNLHLKLDVVSASAYLK